MKKKSLTVSDLPRSERPRERLQKYGAGPLSQQEILAVILSRGGAGKPVLILAQDLLYRFKDLKGVVEASLEELMNVGGIGLAKAAQLKAAGELARRCQMVEADAQPGRVITRAQDVFDLIRPEIGDAKVEHFFLVALDTRGKLIHRERVPMAADSGSPYSRAKLIRIDEVSKGSLNATVVHPREVFRAAIAAHAAAVILVHNHPSGDPEPSDDDIALTRRLVSAGQVLGIPVQDHVIVTDKGFASLRSRNLI